MKAKTYENQVLCVLSLFCGPTGISLHCMRTRLSFMELERVGIIM